jgi:hypothetical protein
MLYHTALPSLYSSTELLPHTGTLRARHWKRRLQGCCGQLSSSYCRDFLAELLLQQWSGPSYCNVTNLGTVAVAVAVAVARHAWDRLESILRWPRFW